MKLVIAGELNELIFIYNKTKAKNHKYFYLPLSLETLIFCEEKKLNYLNPINFLKNNFHYQGIISSNKLISKFDFLSIKYEAHKKDFKNFIRKIYNQAFFVNNLILAIEKKYKINEIIISGLKFENNFNLIEIIRFFFSNKKNYKIKILSKKIQIISKEKNTSYKLNMQKINLNDKNILITSAGYNLSRIFCVLIFLGYTIYVLKEKESNSFFSKVLELIGIKSIYFQKKKIINNSFKLKKINFKENNINYTDFINKLMLRFNHSYNDINQKTIAIKKFLTNNNFLLIISVIARGYRGAIIEIAKNLKIKTLGISHGTLSKSFNKYDKIYKGIISEAVFTKYYDYFVAQTKITKSFFSKKIINPKILNFGNIIFSKKQFSFRKNKILYAVTTKNLNQMQFLGQDLYYEFYDNLKMLNSLGNQYEIIVNLHPSVNKYCVKKLNKIFSNLNFQQKNISKILKEILVTISFSSTVIEDSICSKVPVILFDRWNRCKHCESSRSTTKKNEPIYYVNTLKNLKKCIETIKYSKKIKFEKISLEDFSYFKIINLIQKKI